MTTETNQQSTDTLKSIEKRELTIEEMRKRISHYPVLGHSRDYLTGILGEDGKMLKSPYKAAYIQYCRRDEDLSIPMDQRATMSDHSTTVLGDGSELFANPTVQSYYNAYCAGVASVNRSHLSNFAVVGRLHPEGITFSEKPVVHIDPRIAHLEAQRLNRKIGPGFVALRIPYREYKECGYIHDTLMENKSKHYKSKAVKKAQAAVETTAAPVEQPSEVNNEYLRANAAFYHDWGKKVALNPGHAASVLQQKLAAVNKSRASRQPVPTFTYEVLPAGEMQQFETVKGMTLTQSFDHLISCLGTKAVFDLVAKTKKSAPAGGLLSTGEEFINLLDTTIIPQLERDKMQLIAVVGSIEWSFLVRDMLTIHMKNRFATHGDYPITYVTSVSDDTDNTIALYENEGKGLANIRLAISDIKGPTLEDTSTFVRYGISIEHARPYAVYEFINKFKKEQ